MWLDTSGMKYVFTSSLLLATGTMLILAACQTTHSATTRSARAVPPNSSFDARTTQTYDPETRSFEQQPPFDRQANKSGTLPGS